MARGKQMLGEMDNRVLVCEGVMGTMLTARGINYRNTAEVNLTHPEVVAEIHRSYQQAGAEVFQTNSFAANIAMLRRAGLDDQAASIQTAAVRIAREAVGQQAYLAAGAGPTGELVEPLGELSRDEVVAIYRQQFEVMLATGLVDFVLLETFEDMGELQAAIRAVREVDLNIVIAATMSFSIANGRTMMGVSGTEAARQLAAEGVDIIGANCGDLDGLMVAVREMCQAADRPLMVQANAGQPQLVDGETVFCGTPQESGQLAAQLIACGVRLVGGCCGTTPDHIREIARAAGATA